MGKQRQRLYSIRYDPDDLPAYVEDIGTVLRLAGLLFQGKGTSIVMLFPAAEIVVPAEYAEPTLAEWSAILERSDDPLIFERGPSGVVKAVHRKAQRIISAGVQWKVYHRDDYHCMYCGVVGQPLTCDHFVPMELGGEDDISNLLACCRRCNKEKGDRNPEEFCDSKGYDYQGLQFYLEGKLPRAFVEHLRSVW